MLVLAIDTTSPVGSVAVLRDSQLVAVASSESEETHSAKLFRQLKNLLEEHRLAMPEFDLYAVAAGPGSFTGVRVGLTAVKGWMEVYGKPAVPVSALQAVAAQAPAAAPLVAAVTDARRGQLYAGLYERAAPPEASGLRRRGEDIVMSPAECFSYLASQARGESMVFATPAPEWLATLLSASSCGSADFRSARIETASAVLAPSIGSIGIECARRGEVVDAVSLDANYVRRSDAEVLGKMP
jgi:tRNA threonylcarbamoyladenosine biosynthesis protein TsaB